MAKRLKLSWKKASLGKGYLIIPNRMMTDLSEHPYALALLLTILSNESEYFEKKEEVYKRLGWTITNKDRWLDALDILKSKGYVSGVKGEYVFSNIPMFDKVKSKKKPKLPKQPKNSVFTKEDWKGHHSPESETESDEVKGKKFDNNVELPF